MGNPLYPDGTRGPALPAHLGVRYTRLTALNAHYARLRGYSTETMLAWLMKCSEIVTCLWVIVLLIVHFF